MPRRDLLTRAATARTALAAAASTRAGGPRRRSTRLAGVARRAVWWLLDYAYVAVWQTVGFLRPGGADRFVDAPDGRGPTVVLIPGVYEPWQFMRPLAALLHRNGHPVHVVPTLGYNRGAVPEMARLVAQRIEERDLRDVVLVCHSKGGLIGKYAMLHHDPDGRILAMAAINTPFGGSPYARWIPVEAIRAFVPTDAVLAALTADRVTNARITSISGPFDPHIPGGSDLEGATNVHLRTPGHFRILSDRQLAPTVLAVLEQARTAAAG
ncbi:triacylglycerol lipase [uncultured Cellulomonas sp.]|uniref:esterase/lipase family protein n=1 Tax=uncultured Cellulomonas sp. TaxID=189682 RepID=UPI00263A2EF5|nr:alpha/beta hydrolase [uncultured Cellulomonas sp.]